MRISDWSSDVCSSDLAATWLLDLAKGWAAVAIAAALFPGDSLLAAAAAFLGHCYPVWLGFRGGKGVATLMGIVLALHWPCALVYALVWLGRSEEHTSELQSLMRISFAVFCLKKKTIQYTNLTQ